MRKIAVVTGTRAEYGYLKPLMAAIAADPTLELLPIVTGMHLLPEYGESYTNVVKDFPNAIKIPMTLKGDCDKDMALYLASGVLNLAEYFSIHPVDIIVVFGDRSESLAAALVGLYLNIPVAHINGGDITGTIIDESIRHAITKLAHIHFVHTKGNAERVQKLGEEPRRIHVVGALTLDSILHEKLLSKEDVFSKYRLDPTQTTLLVVQHPITTLEDKALSQLEQLLQALDSAKYQTVMLYPNCDAGGKKFIDLIEKYKEKTYIHIFKTLPYIDYLSLLNAVDVMVGNSSSGIIESPSFKLPVVNLKSRQQGRERSENIIDVDPEKEKILKALDYSLHNQKYRSAVQKCKNKFGDGNAAPRIVKVLKEVVIDTRLIQKQITY